MKVVKIIIIIVLILVSYLFIEKNIKPTDKKIQDYLSQNDSLKKATDSILKIEKQYENQLSQQDAIINSQKEQMINFDKKISQVNDKITILKYSYEAANNHANNFSSIELQRYFADSIR
jgi:archaellum component FlaC